MLLVLGIFALGAILSESARPVHILEQAADLLIRLAAEIITRESVSKN